MTTELSCKHCGKRVVRTNWYDGPGWNHATGEPTCVHLKAEPDEPACAACDKAVEILPDGIMIHPDGTGHEGVNRRGAVAPADALLAGDPNEQ
jgi:hypothetical protein